ncbi:chromodomain protein, partial [Euroglyphus maynei]
MGGLNRVNNRNRWKHVINKLGLGDQPHTQSEREAAITKLKSIYKNYLHPFHELHRKLGPAPVLIDTVRTTNARPSRGEHGDKKLLMPYEEFMRKNGRPDTKNIKINDCLEVLYGKGREMEIFRAKVLKIEQKFSHPIFYVHYHGWSTRYDEWINALKITKILQGECPPKRARNKRNSKTVDSTLINKRSTSDTEDLPARTSTPGQQRKSWT